MCSRICELIKVVVTLKHEDEAGFEFVEKDGSTMKTTMKKAKRSKDYNLRTVSVPGGGISKAVYFPIVPTTVGNVKLSVNAQAGQAGDAVEQVLRVEVCNVMFNHTHFLMIDSGRGISC